ncbi:Hypothetical protein BJL86_1889 [Dietzia timorensis]|uniref:Uncharacterized protein n=1 Tax=Dietzia timorensis TaxID=499555 RepID=A0A173LPW8_9ACTN|nr:Hypothetical protein BJL86_1889 [Dietzia timorensis]
MLGAYRALIKACRSNTHRVKQGLYRSTWQTGQKWLDKFMLFFRTIRVPQRSHGYLAIP